MRPVSRPDFDRQRALVQAIERREGRLLALVSVGLGVGQLLFIRWADAHLIRSLRLGLEGGCFVAYIALVGYLLWRMQARVRSASPRCPQCAVRLRGDSLRIAAATRHCDRCGGQVIA